MIVESAIAVIFTAAWPLVWQTCAPPSPICATAMCAAVCVNPWTQLPEVAVFGALLGLVPAIIVAIGLWRMERMPPAKAGTRGLALLSLTTVAVGAIEFLVYL